MSQRYWPFDSGAGASVTESNWRSMAKLWLSDGVIRGDLNGLAVAQRGAGANKSVDIATGRAWVDGHFYESDALENLVIADNASGNARIDRIVIRADFTGNTVALAVVQGTPGASPVPPALTQSSSTWEIPLAQVAVANGFASILTANITDERQYAAGKSDWQHVPATLTYDSANAPTYVMASTVDLTGIVPVGARFRCVQVAAVVYGIVTAVSATKLTIYGGTDYTLGNAAISSPEFSIAKIPDGFNADPAKWTQTLSDTSDRTQASAGAGTWYNPGSLKLDVPIGAWFVSHKANVGLSAGSGLFSTLSTAANSESDSGFTSSVQGVAAPVVTMGREKELVVAAKTSYYLNVKTGAGSSPTVGFYASTYASPTIIRAVCAYL